MCDKTMYRPDPPLPAEQILKEAKRRKRQREADEERDSVLRDSVR